MQEEFNRYQGYWWQPNKSEGKNSFKVCWICRFDSGILCPTDGIYRIVYEEVDESDVCLFTFPSSQSVGGDFEEYRFPRAGTPNAKSKLKMVQFTLSETLHITDICVKDLQYPLTFSFPWLEYIVRVGWTPDSQLYATMSEMMRSFLSNFAFQLQCMGSNNESDATAFGIGAYSSRQFLWIMR